MPPTGCNDPCSISHVSSGVYLTIHGIAVFLAPQLFFLYRHFLHFIIYYYFSHVIQYIWLYTYPCCISRALSSEKQHLAIFPASHYILHLNYFLTHHYFLCFIWSLLLYFSCAIISHQRFQCKHIYIDVCAKCLSGSMFLKVYLHSENYVF